MPMQISISNAIGGGGGAQGSGGGSSFASTNSFTFDGNSDYIDFGNPASLQITGALSISAWVKLSASASGVNAIILKDNLGLRCYDLVTTDDGLPRFVIWNTNNSYLVDATTDIEDGLWHHVVGVFSPSNSLKIYVDGVLEATNSTSIPSSIDNDNSPVTIGALISSNVIFWPFLGNMDEVSVFNTELSGGFAGSDITTIYNNGVPNDITSLSPLSWWRMGEAANYTGRNWDLIDQGSGGNNGFSDTLPSPPAQPSTDVPT
jgi:hypothetical protein